MTVTQEHRFTLPQISCFTVETSFMKFHCFTQQRRSLLRQFHNTSSERWSQQDGGGSPVGLRPSDAILSFGVDGSEWSAKSIGPKGFLRHRLLVLTEVRKDGGSSS